MRDGAKSDFQGRALYISLNSLCYPQSIEELGLQEGNSVTNFAI